MLMLFNNLMQYCYASREVSRRVAISVFGEKNPWRGLLGWNQTKPWMFNPLFGHFIFKGLIMAILFLLLLQKDGYSIFLYV